MPVHAGSVLVDANTIIEAHKKGCWAALASRYRLETVEECFAETQTGAQGRRPEERIDSVALRASLSVVHIVTKRELASLELLDGPFLDAGEKALWAHALPRKDAWVLCGPDRASMSFGHVNGARDRLVSLGGLLTQIGHRPRVALASHYEQGWLDDVLSKLLLGIL
jgi:hypothetical protein